MPLAGVAADKAVKIIEAHAGGPLIERPRLARLVKGRVMVLAEPRGCVPVFLQDGTDGAFLDRDDGVVTWGAGRCFPDHSETSRVMVASGDDRPRRRAERRRMEIRIAQAVRGNAIHGGSGYDAAKGAVLRNPGHPS